MNFKELMCKWFGHNMIIQRYSEKVCTEERVRHHCRRICTRCKTTAPCNQFLSGGNNMDSGEA